MKKFFVSIVVLVMSTASLLADGLTATMQSGDKLMPFYGVNAFKQAYEAADSGAVITLSAGRFNNVDTIAKPLTVIGSFAFDSTKVEATLLESLVITANKVTVEGINFSGNITLGNIEDCKIAHTWIDDTLKYTSTQDWHTNTLIDQCVVKYDAAIKQSKNYMIKNTTLYKFVEYNTSDNIAFITNCVVYNFVFNHGNPNTYSNSSDWQTKGTPYTPDVPVAIYKNNILRIDVTGRPSSSSYGHYNVFVNAPSEFYNNQYAMMYYNLYDYRYEDFGDYYMRPDVYYNPGCQNEGNSKIEYSKILPNTVYPATPSNPGKGQDGTLTGPQGGTGFSQYPNIPRITSKSIDSNTDATGKLNVKITVKAQ